jgi:hypothetical protein
MFTVIDWLFTVLCPAQRIFHVLWRRRFYRPVKGCKIWAYALRSGPLSRDLYRASSAVTRGLGFSGLIRRTAPFSRLLRHTRGCWGSILTRILLGSLSVAYYDTQGVLEDLFLPGSSRVPYQSPITTHKGFWRTYSYPDPDGLFTVKWHTCKWWTIINLISSVYTREWGKRRPLDVQQR